MGNCSSSSSSAAAAALDGCSKSTILAAEDKETGSHVLTVDGYSKTKGRGAGNSINSGTFTVGGHSWYIAYFPDGVRRYLRNEWISAFVYLENPGTDVAGAIKAQFELKLLKHNGKPMASHTNTGRSPILTFSGPGPHHWGYDMFFRHGHLQLSSQVLKHDGFQIRCDVTVIRENRVERVISRALAVLPPNLHRHLGDLLESQVGWDVTFDVGGELFTAHKAVLATRSSVFMASLFGDMKEKATSWVQIDDMDPDVFRAMLHFIYTDSLPKVEDGDMMVMSQHLLVVADKYNLERLKLICEDKLRGYINSKTVVTTLLLAERHGSSSLQEACKKFLMSGGNFKPIMASNDFKQLMSSCPALLKELVAKHT